MSGKASTACSPSMFVNSGRRADSPLNIESCGLAVANAMKSLHSKLDEAIEENGFLKEYNEQVLKKLKMSQNRALELENEKNTFENHCNQWKQRDEEMEKIIAKLTKKCKQLKENNNALEKDSKEFKDTKIDVANKVTRMREDNQKERKRFENEIKSMKDVIKQSNKGLRDVENTSKKFMDDKEKSEELIKKIKLKLRKAKEDFGYKKDRLENEKKDL
jgi:chromosome segregation ATPase